MSSSLENPVIHTLFENQKLVTEIFVVNKDIFYFLDCDSLKRNIMQTRDRQLNEANY